MFIHFLLTRFNLKIPAWEKTRDNKPIDENKLEHRFNLFEQYCFPSVINQSNKNFKWLVFFDIDTLDNYIRSINNYRDSFKNFIPIFTTSNLYIKELYKNINKLLNNNITHIITTRLDNDDAVHINFIDRIQSCFNYQDLCIVDITNGYIYRIEPRKELALYDGKRNNQFISLIESVNPYITIYSRPHNKWEYGINRIDIKDRLWLQIIHNYNKYNFIKPGLTYIKNNDLLKMFSINDTDKILDNDFNIFIKNLISKTVHFLRAKYKKIKSIWFN